MRVSLPITTVAWPSRASARPAAQPSFRTKSAEIGPSPTRPRMPSVPKYLRVPIVASRSGAGRVADRIDRRLRHAHHQGEQRGEAAAHLAPVDDQVDCAVLEQELAALETLRQRLAHRLLDHAGAGE